MNKPLVSILIRTHNRPVTLARAVQSVIEQTYRPLELVIINDGGEKLDAELLNKITDNGIKLNVINLTENQGRAYAANKAMEQAKGAALLFLDDDDWIDSGHIIKLEEALERNPDILAAYSDTACITSPTDTEIKKVFDYEFDPLRLAFENYLPIHAVLFRNNTLTQTCKFNTELNIYEDWNFWVQLASVGKMKRVPGITAWYSAQLSGVGFSNAPVDYTAATAEFFKQSCQYYTDQQISIILFMCRNFFKLDKQNKQHEKLIDELQLVLQDNRTREIEAYAQLKSSRERELEAYAQLKSSRERELEAYEQLKYNREREALVDADRQQLQLVVRSLDEIRSLLQQKKGFSAFIEKALATLAGLDLKKKIKRKTRTFIQLAKSGDFQGIYIRLARNTQGIFKKLTRSTIEPSHTIEPTARKTGICILSTPHTLYVANTIKSCLESYGISVSSVTTVEPNEYEDSLYIIICPQLFNNLPEKYIAFQMEQSVSSRWFDSRYIDILKKSIAVIDYSKVNLEYLQNTAGINFSKLYYLPISNLSQKNKIDPTIQPEYDVVFYGDINNDRRRLFLDTIKKRFKTLVVSEVFGDDLYHQLKKAKVLVNIHYYEGALLETTRIYEALSLGLNIVSESSSDISDHVCLNDWVTFVEVGNIDAMMAEIQQQIEQPRSLSEIPDDLAGLRFHVGRMLVGLGLLDTTATKNFPSALSGSAADLLCLSMPESYHRHKDFRKRHPDVELFHGLRFREGWIGCALSYRYLAQQALVNNKTQLEIWEDDVLLSETALNRWKKAKELFVNLETQTSKCDLLSGLLADVSDETKILDVMEVDGETYVVIDRMISAVCNFYGLKTLTYMAKWNCTNHDVHLNTMDRYLESKALRVLVPLPFVAGHSPELDSTLWGCNNTQYDSLIAASEAKLYKKLQSFRSN